MLAGLRGKQRGRRYTTVHVWTPAELRGSALSIQRRWTGSVCQRVVLRLAETSWRMENPTILLYFQVARAALTCLFWLRPPARGTTSSVQLFSPSLLFAMQQQYSVEVAKDGVSVYVCVILYVDSSVCGVCAVTGAQDAQEER